MPLRSELPELADDLQHAAAASALTDLGERCFGQLHTEGVFTYFGCDRQVTPTHFDGFENLLVCLCGTKRLWLFPPSDARHLYCCAGDQRKEPSRAAAPPFQRFDELTPELRATFPEMAGAAPLEVQLRAGDCLYLPACWWHCVEGSRERNMILNWRALASHSLLLTLPTSPPCPSSAYALRDSSHSSRASCSRSPLAQVV